MKRRMIGRRHDVLLVLRWKHFWIGGTTFLPDIRIVLQTLIPLLPRPEKTNSTALQLFHILESLHCPWMISAELGHIVIHNTLLQFPRLFLVVLRVCDLG